MEKERKGWEIDWNERGRDEEERMIGRWEEERREDWGE